ncbi:MAG: DUF188 domain-containing protein [Gammaproteobacteria bacterium]|jgi:uncharacterized protein YaiI (UPF0178 family)|nr:DUF188 domain-containing protein [Gammaproteobacteria bacterium]|tara:strand:- start:74 stop:550 length:477 start_codon:yes stop_codon:yes gene_type:complete
MSASFKIWVDADACPNLIKNVIFRLADNRQVDVVLVSNHYVKTPNSRFVSAKQVGKGFDEADNEIIALMSGGDLVVTGDLPLANDVIQKRGFAINPRGTVYDEENIKSHLSRRDLMEDLRDSGVVSGGPSALNKKNVQEFANAIDRLVTKLEKASAKK